MKIFLLRVGAIGYFTSIGSFAAYLIVGVLDIFGIEDSIISYPMLAVWLVISSIIAFIIFLVKCPFCENYIFRPPWNRTVDENINVKTMAGVLTGNKVSCMSCGRDVRDAQR